MNLHLMLDEKVISRTIEYFEEVLPNQNKYIIFLEKGKKESKYVCQKGDSIVIVNYGTDEFWQFVGDVNQYQNIIAHHLSQYAVDFINKTKHRCVTWIAWGADLYGGLLRPKGYKLFYNEKDINDINIKGASLIRLLYVKIFKWMGYRKKISAVKKIKFICAPPGDYQLLLRYYPEFKKLINREFFYYPLDSLVSKELMENRSLGNDIIVGNSASIYGNHEEVFIQLSKLDIAGRKIKVPLSYGAAEMVKYITSKGSDILGESFLPILDFMPLDEYNRFLCSATTYIYGNYRQEATGNIVVALYLGGTVFLHPSNTLLNEFKALGCVCFSTDELPQRINYRLTDKEIENNRGVIFSKYNHQRLLELIKEEFGLNGIS